MDWQNIERLLERAKRGEAGARDQFFKLLYPYVLEQAKRGMVWRQEAEDLAQEVMLAVLLQFDRLRPGQLPQWLSGTIGHKIVDRMHIEQRREEALTRCRENIVAVAGQRGLRPDATYRAQELRLLLQEILAELKTKDRELLSILLEGATEKEMKRKLGDICGGTLYARVHRLRIKLRQRLRRPTFRS